MNPYRILGIDRNASEEEIKTAYRTLAKKYHPDAHPEDPDAEEIMHQINEAYNLIQTMKANPDIDEAIFDYENYSYESSFAPEEYSKNRFSVFFSPVFRRTVILLLIVAIAILSIISAFFQGVILNN